MMNPLLQLLSVTTLLFLLLNCTPTVSQTDCAETLTTDQFFNYVRSFPECRASNIITIFRHYAPILDSVYDEDDKFIGKINYDEVEAFCGRVAGCKNALSSCQGRLYDTISDAGRALCQGGLVMSLDLTSAVSTLSKGGCDLSKLDAITMFRDGCFLGRDEALPQTYVFDIARDKKISRAQMKCSLRFLEGHKVCSAAGAKAYGTILEASQNLEKIGLTYHSSQSYYQDFGRDRKSMRLFGSTHLSYDGAEPVTCTGLPAGNLLLWNTRVRITGSFEPVKPMSELSTLTQVTIQFYGSDGVIVDTYTASTIDSSEFKYSTLRKQASLYSDIVSEKLADNQVLLTYSDIASTVSVGYFGSSLTLVVFMPSNLLEEESVGLLVDSCQIYSGTLVSASSRDVDVTSDCENRCSSVEDSSLCAIDCSYQLLEYLELHGSLKSMTERASVYDYGSSSSVSLTCGAAKIVLSVLLSVLSYFHSQL